MRRTRRRRKRAAPRDGAKDKKKDKKDKTDQKDKKDKKEPSAEETTALYTTWSMGDVQSFQAQATTIKEEIGSNEGGRMQCPTLHDLAALIPEKVLFD